MQNSQEFITDDLLQETVETETPETELQLTEESLPIAEAQVDQITEESEQAEPARELTEIEKLTNRRTGFWHVNLDLNDLKWIKNSCQNKFEFTGPNEAFMLMNCYLGFAAVVAREEAAAKQKEASQQPPIVQASAIEACALLINRFNGTGLETAQRVFRIAVALNTIIMEMQSLDKQINSLKAEAAEPAQPNTQTEEDGI